MAAVRERPPVFCVGGNAVLFPYIFFLHLSTQIPLLCFSRCRFSWAVTCRGAFAYIRGSFHYVGYWRSQERQHIDSGTVEVVVRREVVFPLSEILEAALCNPSIGSRRTQKVSVEEKKFVLRCLVAYERGCLACHCMLYDGGI